MRIAHTKKNKHTTRIAKKTKGGRKPSAVHSSKRGGKRM